MQNHSSALASRPSDPVLRAMFSARKRVFVDLLGWDIPVLEDTFEIDQFDTRDATYLVLTDNLQSHRASARLLPTRGPHILGDLFARLCSDAVPTGSDIHEITRFCIEPALTRPERRRARDQLVTALVDHALAAGLSGYTAVATRAWFRQIAGFGWRCSALGPGCRVAGEDLVALRIEIDDDTPGDLARGGIHSPGSYRIVGSVQELVA